MKKKTKYSLVDKLNEQFIYINFVIVIFLIVMPLSYYQLFISSQYYKLEKYITQTENITASDVGNYVIEEGYDLRSDLGEVFETKSKICQVDTIKVQEKTKSSSKKVIVTYTNGCEPMVIGLNYVLLHGFTIFYFLIAIVSSLVVIVANMYNMNGIKKKINHAFYKVEEQVEEIKVIGQDVEYEKKDAAFIEFQVLIDNIDELNSQINAYISERHNLVSTLNHELKSPINKMNSLIQAYQMQIPGYDNCENMIEELETELEVLLEIVNFTLDVFVKANIQEITEINLNQLVQDTLNRNLEKFAVRNLEYEIISYDQLIIKSDYRMVELIISNLIENISKYALEDSTFKIRLTSNKLEFRNKVSGVRKVGTQQGLKLSSQLVKSIGYDLVYSEINEEFKVIIIKNLNQKNKFTE